jgi:FMN phosphatase YigB (HAD superfamily)
MRQEGKLPDIAYDVIIDSSEVGAIKPETKIFEIATERAGVPPEEIFFIDDSRVNVIAASKMKWNVMWFDDSHPDASVERVREALEPVEA